MNTLFRGVTVVFLLFILWIIYSANIGEHNIFFNITDGIPYGDKLGHFFLFGLLTLFLNITLKFKRFKYWQKLPLGTFLVIVFVLLEELSQGFSPNRNLDIMDLIADALGIITFTYFGNILFTNRGLDIH